LNTKDGMDLGIRRTSEPKHTMLHTTTAGYSGKHKIIRYDFVKLVNIGPFVTFMMKGTVFNLDKNLWINMAKYLVLFGISALFVAALTDDVTSFKEESMPNIIRAAENLQNFCPFLFGLFVSLSLGRWWTMRCDGIGCCADYITNICCFLTANAARRLPREEDWQLFVSVQSRICRYGLASLNCIAKESRGPHAPIDEMVTLGLLTEEEKTLLESVEPHSRAEALWCWMSALSSEVMEMVKLPPPNMNMLFTHIRNGLKGVHVIHQHMNTQLPFPYVHMITLLVNVHNAVVAMVSGLKFGVAVREGRPANCVVEIVQLIIVPTMYQGLLQICMFLSDPFGDDIIDFPILEYMLEVSEDCKAICKNTREMYLDRWAEGLSPLPNAAIIAKLPKPVHVNAGKDGAELERPPEPPPAELAVPPSAAKAASELPGALLSSMMSQVERQGGNTSLSSEVHLKAAFADLGFSNSESVSELSKWLVDVREHIAKIPPMPTPQGQKPAK